MGGAGEKGEGWEVNVIMMGVADADLGTVLALFVFWALVLGLIFSPFVIAVLWRMEQGGKK